jgi:hypothetical protein
VGGEERWVRRRGGEGWGVERRRVRRGGVRVCASAESVRHKSGIMCVSRSLYSLGAVQILTLGALV